MNSILFGFLLIIILTLSGSFAAIQIKISSSSTFIKMLLNKNFHFGIILYLFASILNIIVLDIFDFTVVLPATSITYVWTLVLSKYILKEKINLKRFIGVFLILIGALTLFIV